MTLMTKFFYLTLLLFAFGTTSVHAEKADRLQNLNISSESQSYDGNKKVTVYLGAVHMVKGTLIINADRLEVVEDANGGKIGTLFSNPGKLVTYRQKRDGGPDLWAEGEADKVVYDDTLELIKLFNNARLVLLDGKKRTHESSGIYISYDSRSDFMQVHNTLEGVSAPGAGYTNAIIYPTEDKPKSDVKSDKPNSKPATSKPATDKPAAAPAKPEGAPNE